MAPRAVNKSPHAGLETLSPPSSEEAGSLAAVLRQEIGP